MGIWSKEHLLWNWDIFFTIIRTQSIRINLDYFLFKSKNIFSSGVLFLLHISDFWFKNPLLLIKKNFIFIYFLYLKFKFNVCKKIMRSYFRMININGSGNRKYFKILITFMQVVHTINTFFTSVILMYLQLTNKIYFNTLD